jgi:hypothetical protein
MVQVFVSWLIALHQIENTKYDRLSTQKLQSTVFSTGNRTGIRVDMVVQTHKGKQKVKGQLHCLTLTVLHYNTEYYTLQGIQYSLTL